MRWLARAAVLTAVFVVLFSSSCSSQKTGDSCSSARGTCVYTPGGGVCAVPAASSAQDCISGSDQKGWLCCLVIVEDLDGSTDAEAGTALAEAAAEASADGSSATSSSDSATDDGAVSSDDSSTEEAGSSDEDASDAGVASDAGAVSDATGQ
jgi:hypothetical protein